MLSLKNWVSVNKTRIIEQIKGMVAAIPFSYRERWCEEGVVTHNAVKTFHTHLLKTDFVRISKGTPVLGNVGNT